MESTESSNSTGMDGVGGAGWGPSAADFVWSRTDTALLLAASASILLMLALAVLAR